MGRAGDGRHGRRIGRCLLFAVHVAILASVEANLPTFDEDSRMRILLLPASTKAGSTIYRVRASDPDFDHPLEFSFLSRNSPNLLTLEPIPCGKQHSVCEANVILNEDVSPHAIYELSLSVRDTSGGVTTVFCTIQVTNVSASLADSFPRLNQYVTVPESAPKDSVVDYLIAAKNPANNRGIRMELKKTHKLRFFRLSDKLAGANRTNCSIVLERQLDFETQTVHVLRILALNAYVNSKFDTRNVVEVLIYVLVMDVQDTPPVFVRAPSVTAISDTLDVGRVVLRVKAEDGDKGNPRDIGYALLADSSPFAPFFSMDPMSGELRVRKKLFALNQMLHSKAPFLLTIIAEEMGTHPSEPNTTSTIDVALMIEDQTNDAPEFNQERYVAHLTENAAVGTALYFGDGQNPQVVDNDQGHDGIFSLSLIGDNSTFEISPSVAENTASFTIRVKNPAMIDFERTQQIRFKILAEEVQHGSNRASTADVIVYITDENDHAPVFEKESYRAEIPEHSPPGTVVAQVKATDKDSGRFGSIRYTQLHGLYAKAFVLDPISGLVTVGSGSMLDREAAPEITLTVEAKDTEGNGRSATVPLNIRLQDINDNAPHFIGLPYESSLTPDLSRLVSKVVVQAVDNDTSQLNGAVRYEIVRGNFESKFRISELSGEVTLMAPLTSANIPPLIQLHVRAYDLGVPHLHAETIVHIYTQEVTSRIVHFLLPKRVTSLVEGTEDLGRLEGLLTLITGAPTTINDIQPYHDDAQSMAMAERADELYPNNQKTILMATIRYPPQAAVVDVQRVRDVLVTDEFDLLSGVTVEKEYRNRNIMLMWTLLILILVFIAIMTLLGICCCCPGCYCYSDRKKSHRYGGTVRPIMVGGSQLTTPGRKEAWSGKKISRIRRATRDRLTSVSEGDSVKREPYRHGNGNLRHVYSEDQTDTEFLEIQPEDSASHHGTGENAFYYQRMGNADVMRLDSSGNHGKTSVRRSNSEPKLNEAAGDHQEGSNSSKSMINFPPRSNPDDPNWRAVSESFHRNSQGKYVQSPILEETDSALEREMGSGYYLRPKAFLDYETRNARRSMNGLAGYDSETRQTWQGVLATQTAATGATTSVQPVHRRPPLERELPYFDNRSSFLRHRVSLSKLNGGTGKKSRTKNASQTNGDESESGSSNERSQRNSRRNSVSNQGAVAVNAPNKAGKFTDDDRDSGIALNANQQLAHRSRFLEKKSIFTIAYDEVATAKLPATSDNLPS